DDEAQGIPVEEVVALVEEDGAELVALEPAHEAGRQADPRPEEPVAEGERAIVDDDVDATLEPEPARRRPHARRHADLARHERADEHRRRAELAEERPYTERDPAEREAEDHQRDHVRRDRKSTRLNSSHEWISYAV